MQWLISLVGVQLLMGNRSKQPDSNVINDTEKYPYMDKIFEQRPGWIPDEQGKVQQGFQSVCNDERCDQNRGCGEEKSPG